MAVKRKASADDAASITNTGATTKEWAGMFFLGGDNSLGGTIDTKLSDLEDVGSSKNVDLLVKFDRPGDSGLVFQHIEEQDLQESTNTAQENSADKQALIDFVLKDCAAYPSNRSMLILWSHGSAVDPESGGHAAHGSTSQSNVLRIRGAAGAISHNLRYALFPKEALESVNRPIEETFLDLAAAKAKVPLETLKAVQTGTEAAAGKNVQAAQAALQLFNANLDLFAGPDRVLVHYLDNKQLAAAISTINNDRHIHILGLETCLMATIEVFYELRKTADVVIATQGSLPLRGWRYQLALRPLQDPLKETDEIASDIVQHGAKVATRTGYPLTISAIRMEYIEKAAEAVSTLAREMYDVVHDENDIENYRAIVRAHFKALPFVGTESVDLLDFCDKLIQEDPKQAIRTAALGVLDLRYDLIIASFASDDMLVQGATGISISFPRRRHISRSYLDLDFCKNTLWDEFLQEYLKRTFPGPDELVQALVRQAAPASANHPTRLPGHH